MAEFENIIGSDLVDGKKYGYTSTSAQRSSEGRGIIHMGKSADTGTVVHEMGHWLEEMLPGLHSQALDFLDRRTVGERSISLRKATGNSRYSIDEVTKVDKFLDPYMGKQYSGFQGRHATEIISMGLEMLYRDPVGFAKGDPDYFDFIWNIIRRKK